ncbi:Ig-like domain-containing protein, partial [Desulfofalx alkaliphila]|uniref:Ig-like domain-containing protein n=1 Tax=Desulfofalx alkaliphila TaxID=105483 RepID=UPI001EE4740E
MAPSDAQAEPELVITGTGLKEDVYLYQSDWLDFDNEDFIERYYSSVNNWNFYKIWRVRGWDLIDLLGEDNLKEGNWSIRFTASDGLSMAWTIDDLYGRYYYPEFSTDDGVQVGPMIAAYRAALFEPNYAGKPSEIEWEDRELTEADFDHEHPRVYMGQPEGEPEFKNQPFFIRKLVRIVVGEERPVPVTGVSITDGDQALEEGQTVQLNVVVEPSNAADKSVTWSSDNESVATVNEDGLVTAVGVGTATITVTTNEGNFTDSITVTVTEASSEPVVFTVAGDGVYGGLKEYTLSQLQAFGITTGEYIYTSSGQTVTDNCTG